MEVTKNVFWLNKAINCYVKYRRYALWTWYGVTTFYVLKFLKSHYLDRSSNESNPLPDAESSKENSSAFVSLEENPDAANLPQENLSTAHELEANPDSNGKAAIFPEENPRTTDPPQDANPSVVHQSGRNPTAANRPSFYHKLMQPLTIGLQNPVPRALIGKQSNKNLKNISTYLNWLEVFVKHSVRSAKSERSNHKMSTPTRRPSSERLTTFVGPIGNIIIELPDLKDQVAVNDYIERHFHLSEKYFEQDDYIRGFYHFVLLQFGHICPRTHLELMAKYIDHETYTLAKFFLKQLTALMKLQLTNLND